jgi:hypothetical protein
LFVLGIQLSYLEALAAEYRELQELRERVKKAEAAAAQRLKSRGGPQHLGDQVDGPSEKCRHASSMSGSWGRAN